ncbi:hypothetical protein C9I28_10160 [Pseudoduganella armeniaca]|uniref:Uncharacterized protein n=2 Tax=Pseudoduganella armeniaca TaxID=2072590 RepID=A0A2R4C8Y9_9BURK|nr:hypothetical protein C9I28_10160 [Pseudoduganella armeniaca]
MQSKPPGVVERSDASVQSASVEQGGASMRDRGSMQGTGQDDVGSARGGAGAQQAGWSARQQAQQSEARAEEDRQGLPQESGHGGLEQKQRAGSQESPLGPPGSRQSGSASNAQRQDHPAQSRTDSGSKTARYDDSGEGGGTRYDSHSKPRK